MERSCRRRRPRAIVPWLRADAGSGNESETMQFTEAIKLALQSLWANKMRSILTLLGMVIGVASVIMVVTLTNGARAFVTSKINTYGASVVTISKQPQFSNNIEEYLDFQKRKDVTIDDYRAILD